MAARAALLLLNGPVLVAGTVGGFCVAGDAGSLAGFLLAVAAVAWAAWLVRDRQSDRTDRPGS
jgi:hypothetical protein